MRSRRSSVLPVAVVLVSGLGGATAHADDRVPVVLDYTAPPSCPDANGFLGEIAARTSLPRLAGPGETATVLGVAIQEVEGGYKGSLTLGTSNEPAAARYVSAASCDQVVSALALMTALAIDPNASTAPARKEPPKAASAPPAPASGPPRNESPPHVSSPPAPLQVHYQIMADAELLAGVAPDPVFEVRPSFELGTSGGSLWGSAFRLGAGFGQSTTIGPAGGARFSFLTARLEGCPLFRVVRAVDVAPCAAFDGGRIKATGVGVTPGEEVHRPFVAPGLTLRLEWKIFHFLMFEAAGEGFFPLVRDRFFVGPNDTVHRTPAVVGGATLGLGARFP